MPVEGAHDDEALGGGEGAGIARVDALPLGEGDLRSDVADGADVQTGGAAGGGLREEGQVKVDLRRGELQQRGELLFVDQVLQGLFILIWDIKRNA